MQTPEFRFLPNTPSHRVPSQITTSSSKMDDENSNPSSPYFLPPADNPGTVIVSQPLLSTENYPSWSRVVLLSLSERNKFGFVNG